MDSATHGDRVKAQIIETGLAIWRDDPALFTARGVGKALGMTHSAILYHFGTSDGLKAAVAAEAVKIGCPVIVPQLIATRNPAVADMNPGERQRFLAAC